MNEDWKSYSDKICSRIGWVGAILVVFGYFLNANHYASSWLVWIVGNLCVAGYSINKKAWSTATMSIIISIMNLYGYLKWTYF